MICPQCNTEQPNEAQICQNCSEKLPSTQLQLTANNQEQPNQFPPQGQPNQFPPQGQPNQFPPQGQPNQFPPRGQPNQFPPQGQPNQFPPQGQPNQFPPQGQPNQFQPQGQPNQFQPQGQPNQFQPQGQPNQFQPQGQPNQFHPQGQPNQFQRQGQFNQFSPQDRRMNIDLMMNSILFDKFYYRKAFEKVERGEPTFNITALLAGPFLMLHHKMYMDFFKTFLPFIIGVILMLFSFLCELTEIGAVVYLVLFIYGLILFPLISLNFNKKLYNHLSYIISHKNKLSPSDYEVYEQEHGGVSIINICVLIVGPSLIFICGMVLTVFLYLITSSVELVLTTILLSCLLTNAPAIYFLYKGFQQYQERK